MQTLGTSIGVVAELSCDIMFVRYGHPGGCRVVDQQARICPIISLTSTEGPRNERAAVATGAATYVAIKKRAILFVCGRNGPKRTGVYAGSMTR